MEQGKPASGRRSSTRRDQTTSLPLDVERALVARAKVDTDAFSQLYEHYLPRIHAFAWRRVGNTQAAEDICAATFEAALRGIGHFKWRKGGLAPWLFRIAANQVITHYRQEGRQQSDRGQRAMATMHTEKSIDDLDPVLDETDTEAMRAALDRLNPRYQRAIALRYLGGLEPEAAAQAMGLARPALAVVLSRALKALRKELEADPDWSPGGDSQ